MKRHTTIRELKSFLERVCYIRKFTPRPTLVISGLSKLLKKGNVFIWGVEQPNVFHKISTDHESFAYHMSTIHGKITIVVPGILIPSIQSIEEHWNEVSQHRKGVYGSYASQQLNHYFSSHQILLVTSSHPIKTLLNQPLQSWRIARWLILISQYNIGLKDPQSYQEPSCNKLTDPVPRRREIPIKWEDL